MKKRKKEYETDGYCPEGFTFKEPLALADYKSELFDIDTEVVR